jgi:hypothetical protein
VCLLLPCAVPLTGRNTDGAAWRETWSERLMYASNALDTVVERNAHKWAADPTVSASAPCRHTHLHPVCVCVPASVCVVSVLYCCIRPVSLHTSGRTRLPGAPCRASCYASCVGKCSSRLPTRSIAAGSTHAQVDRWLPRLLQRSQAWTVGTISSGHSAYCCVIPHVGMCTVLCLSACPHPCSCC